MQRGDDGNAQVSEQRQNKAAAGAAVNPVFVLKADHIRIAKIQVIRGAAIGIEIILGEFEPDFGRIFITFRQVIDGRDKTFRVWKLLRHRLAQIIGERRYAAFTREIVTDEGDFFDFRGKAHNRGLLTVIQSTRNATAVAGELEPGSLDLRSVRKRTFRN
jgi:hypothetical protein